MQEQNECEARLRALANLLEFTVEKTRHRFTLTRTEDVSSPVREGTSRSIRPKNYQEPGN